MKRLLIIVIGLLCLAGLIGIIFLNRQPQLNIEQKVNDFKFLYATLEENYPYFGVGKRSTGNDWVAKKEEYIEIIKKTRNDKEYIFALQAILSELGNSHTDLSFVQFRDDYTELYKKVAQSNAKYKKWVETLTDPKIRSSYWKKFLENTEDTEKQTHNNTKNKSRPIYSDSIIESDKIGILRISSFSMNRIEKDSSRIIPFLNKIKDYNYLIIDIQNNGGGATRYWKKNIVEKLASDTLYYPEYLVIKDGKLNRKFYPQYFDKTFIVKRENTLQNIPEELLDGSFRVKVETDTVSPDYPIPFKGKIFLLVNKVVFSSAEGFAYFCKATNWATIAGETTGGDGIGSDPIPFILPESGIVVRVPSLSGFNPDGSLNFEEKTVPDIAINGKDSDQRLANLINYIRNN